MVGVVLDDNGDGGRLVIKNDDVVVEKRIYTQVYLALFGGNVSWWGNYFYDAPKFASTFEDAFNKGVMNMEESLPDLKASMDTDLDRIVKMELATEIRTELRIIDNRILEARVNVINDDVLTPFRLLYEVDGSRFSLEAV